MGDAENVALGFENAERLTHRRDADGELLRDLVLLEAGAARESASQNAFAEKIRDVLLLGLEAHHSGRGGSRRLATQQGYFIQCGSHRRDELGHRSRGMNAGFEQRLHFG